MKFQRFLGGVAAVSLCAAAAPAAAVTISSGDYSAGIGADGELYDAGSGVGLSRGGYDVVAPGTGRDSWGINAAYADGQYYGSNVSSVLTSSTASSAVVTTDTGIGFSVQQTYTFVGNILKIDTVVTNTTADVLSAIFQRNVDFDLNFEETVFGPSGAANGVLDTTYFGFDNPDASANYDFSCGAGCSGTGDLGGGIKIKLGSFNAGASRFFTYYYGVNRAGTTADDLVADAKAAGAKYVMGNLDADGNSAIIGVSGAVPEPAAWAMMIMGFFGLGSMVRRRKAALA